MHHGQTRGGKRKSSARAVMLGTICCWGTSPGDLALTSGAGYGPVPLFYTKQAGELARHIVWYKITIIFPLIVLPQGLLK